MKEDATTMSPKPLTRRTLDAINKHKSFANNWRLLETLKVGMFVKPKMKKKLKQLGIWFDND